VHRNEGSRNAAGLAFRTYAFRESRACFETRVFLRGGETVERQRSLHDFCKEYAAPLSRFFFSRGIPAYDVEDLVQESFMVLLANRSRIQDGKGKAFLFGIASRVLMAYRRKTLLDRLRRRDGDGVTVAQSGETMASAEAAAVQNEQAALLETAVSQLSPRMQQVVRLVYFEGKSRAEAARMMGVARQAVHVMERRALTRLRDHFEIPT